MYVCRISQDGCALQFTSQAEAKGSPWFHVRKIDFNSALAVYTVDMFDIL